MKKRYLILLLMVILFFSVRFLNNSDRTSKKNYDQINKEQALSTIQWAKTHLPQSGVLKEGPDGFVYLKVDDGYINDLFPLLHSNGYVKPQYFRRPNAPGAHISVFYVKERRQTGKISELGKTFSFDLIALTSVPQNHEYIVLDIKSPELENLRKKYGLSPLLNHHDFHITIAKKNLIDNKFRSRLHLGM